MQRVLSFQMARSIGETSEFVTKRMCFSFLFSVGFLCLLCGFLLGRFAAQRSIEFRAEKKRLELAGNGLDNTEYIERLLLQKLEDASFHFQNWEVASKKEEYFRGLEDTLKSLPVFLRVVRNKSYILATVRGTREPDRFVIVSVNGEGIDIALELARIFDRIHAEYAWNPRRTLLFCIFFGPIDFCQDVLPTFVQSRIITYITLHNNVIEDEGHFVLSGSNIMQSTVLEAIQSLKNLDPLSNQVVSDLQAQNYQNIDFQDSKLCVPHIALKFVSNTTGGILKNKNSRRQRVVLAQIVGQTMWRMSESLAIHFNPKNLNTSTYKILKTIESPMFLGMKGKVLTNLMKLTESVTKLNERMEATECTKSLEIRILNDLLLDLDKILLCPRTKSLFSTTMPTQNDIEMVLTGKIVQYEDALQILQDWN